jgi:O-methyltransferase
MIRQDPKDLYLQLIKKTLMYALWPEPPFPLAALGHNRHFLVRHAIRVVASGLGSRGLELVQQRAGRQRQWDGGGYWPAYAHTMIGARRLDNLQNCVETALREGIAGDLAETGVWRGGACILMRAVLAAYGSVDRKVFVADSFQGLPPPEPERYPADQGATAHRASFLAVSQAEVEDNFRKYGLLDEQVVFLPGWFKDSLPGAPIERLAVLRLDGDFYSSTMEVLTALYDRLSPGGFCIIDDYDLPGCRQAVDEFRAQRQIKGELQVVDHAGRFWRAS